MDVNFSYTTTRTITMTDDDIEVLADEILDHIGDYVENNILDDNECFSELPPSIVQPIVTIIFHRIKSHFTE